LAASIMPAAVLDNARPPSGIALSKGVDEYQ
jgi:hypothetical protein